MQFTTVRHQQDAEPKHASEDTSPLDATAVERIQFTRMLWPIAMHLTVIKMLLGEVYML